jgi:diguanylate cyclase (GGDEF)-like protein
VDGQAKSHATSSRLIVGLALVAAFGATLVCAGIGDVLARRSDEHRLAEQRAAVRNTVAEFRVLFAQPGEVDPRFVRMIAHSTGLQSLKFETDPVPGQREMQPVLDGNGRIAGFFTWDRSYPTTRAFRRAMPLLLAIVFTLVGFAVFSLLQLRRARRVHAVREDRARQAADADKHTGLPNHARTLELLDHALANRAEDAVTSFALIKLDGMAEVKANLGAAAGDALYGAIARRLREALPADAVCGRIGSDEFAVVLTAAPRFDTEAMLRISLEALARPHWIETVVRVAAHAGFAQAPRHALTRGELIHRAELALNTAAGKGPGAVVAFDPTIESFASDRQFIQRELPRALSANALEVHYQPIVAAQGARIVGVEALLRWTHPARGAIGPADFIPVAEQMGLMDAIGAFVLRRALVEARHWPDIYVAVNLSPVQVRDRAIVDLVRQALSESGVPPERLMLEITEGVLIDNPEEMLKRIADLHALGVRIALDDFGSGYSNLGYLQKFPLDKLKIDKSFVAALGQSANGGVIIQAIVALGRALGLTVLVEGVETEEQRVLLRLAGCDEMQGFLFARPASAKVIDGLLAHPSRKATGRAAEPLTA